MQNGKRPTPLRESPFAFTRPPGRRRWLDRVRHRSRPDLAERALRHLLSQRDPTRISPSDISALLLEYEVGGPAARHLLVQIWRQVLAAFLSDNEFSDREIAYLDALRGAFLLTEDEVRSAEHDVIHPRYLVVLGDALADARLSDDERAALERLAKKLRLPPEVQQDLYHRSSRAVMTGIVRRTTADRRLSPDELDELASVALHLGVAPDFDRATEATLDRYALFWRIENGGLPSITVDGLSLEAGEICHLSMPAERYELLATGDGSAGEGIVSVRIARGVYYRVGSVSDEPMNRATLRRVEAGRLLVTSRRVLFQGEKATAAFQLRDIPSYQVYADGIVLERRTATGPHLKLNGDVEFAAVVLGAALARG
jgi:hypothetical protein